MSGSLYSFNTNDETNSLSSFYNTLFLLAGLAVSIYVLAKFAESNNRLKYDNRFARIIAGFLVFLTRIMHTKSDDLDMINSEKKLVAVGPHRTGWEAVVVASKMEGNPPRFLATDAFDSLPVVSSFLKMFKAIPVAEKATKGDNHTANAGALELASKALNEEGCVAMFPQGNFSRLGQEPPRVYAGVAKLALEHKIPIHVIRLDGFWSLQNPIIPLFIRNSTPYRAFLSALHMNNVTAKEVCVIDLHLKDENKNLSDKEKINEICAQLYAYYRHTEELTLKQIDTIKTEISDKTHFTIWSNKVKQDELGKELANLKKEATELEKPTSKLMALN